MQKLDKMHFQSLQHYLKMTSCHCKVAFSRNINQGEEFLINYGTGYWIKYGGRPPSSKGKKPGRPSKPGATRLKASTNNTNCQPNAHGSTVKRRRKKANKFSA
jgi:hypothetical protein